MRKWWWLRYCTVRGCFALQPCLSYLIVMLTWNWIALPSALLISYTTYAQILFVSNRHLLDCRDSGETQFLSSKSRSRKNSRTNKPLRVFMRRSYCTRGSEMHSILCMCVCTHVYTSIVGIYTRVHANVCVRVCVWLCVWQRKTLVPLPCLLRQDLPLVWSSLSQADWPIKPKDPPDLTPCTGIASTHQHT